MADRPIIFSAPMIRALLDGRKTQDRRVLKPQPFPCADGWGCVDRNGAPQKWLPCLPKLHPYAPGDRLWVREAWGLGVSDHGDCPRYKATLDYKCGDKINSPGEWPLTWRSPIHMPRRFSRLTLVVTDVRVQRLAEITSADAIAEGCQPHANSITIDCDTPDPRDDFRGIWNSIHGPDAWDANPWVAAISFTVHRCNIDTMEEGTW